MNPMLIAVASLLVYFGFTAVLARMLGLEGQPMYIFYGVLSCLGLSAFGLFYWFRRKSSGGGQQQGAAAEGPSGEVDRLIHEANARLSQAKAANIANLPVVFVIGDRGTAKTSSILNSGLEPELLAGQVYQDNQVAPTRSANIWISRTTALIEAGGQLLSEPSNWTSLVRKLQPGKLASIVGKGNQSPRAVVLCFDIEAFTQQGSTEAIQNVTRYLQGRLGEVSQHLGISFPVYVIFTRCDRLPFFHDYIRNLNNDEATQIFGATLPLRVGGSLGVWAEEETQRVSWAFNSLFGSLCDKRLLLLPREGDQERVPGAYEFPREFRKLSTSLVRFLVDVARPSQLRASPFLRGFYFSGVRPVFVSDAPAPIASVSSKQALEQAGGATRMFRVGVQEQQRQEQAMAAASQGGQRKVPQWTFLSHLFNDVILNDTAAMAASGSSVKTSFARRLLFGLASLLLLGIGIMFTVSYFGNRSLEQSSITAAKGISGTVQPEAIPSEDVLKRLDTLRASLVQLTRYETEGAPFSLRWGLYSGSTIYPDVRRLYYEKFRQVLFGSTQGGLIAFLTEKTRGAPTPTDDYGFAYDTLKAYLLTTSQYKRTTDKSLEDFLGQRLFSRWSTGREAEIGKDRLELAKAQFLFYAGDIKNGNPYSPDEKQDAVRQSRVYLSQFSGIERSYRSLLAAAAKNGPTVSFNQKFAGSAEVLSNTYPVPYAYTKEGWKFISDALKKANFGGEEWVLGGLKDQSIPPDQMTKGILDLYTRDYIDTWRNVIKKSVFMRYGSLDDASRKLTKLTSTSAPLLALMWWTSQNTAIDLPKVADAFRSVQAVVPPAAIEQYIVPANQTYNGGLLKLQTSVDQAKGQKDPNLERQMKDDSTNAKTLTRQLASTFPIDAEAHLEQTVTALLLQPTDLPYVEPDANGGGRRFCAAFDPMTKKFPFNKDAQPEVSLAELGDILKPKTGRLWQFYEANVKPYLNCQNGTCIPAQSPPGPLNPKFSNFFQQMVKFSYALYGADGTEPRYKYTLKVVRSAKITQFEISINGDKSKVGVGGTKGGVWPGSGPPGFRFGLIAGGTDIGG
ncbi:MAG: ImcF-related family protein, partial [Bryobacteraceae bacterium]